MKIRQIYEKSESEMTVVWFGSAGCKLDKITAVDLVFTNASDLSYNGQQFNLSESATSNSYVDIAKNEVTDLDFGSMTVTFLHYGDEQAQKFYLKKVANGIYDMHYDAALSGSKIGTLYAYSGASFINSENELITIPANYKQRKIDADGGYAETYAEWAARLDQTLADMHQNYAEGIEAVRQYMIQHLTVIKGELWYDMMYGLPLVNEHVTKGMIDAEALSIIYSDSEVNEVVSFESEVTENSYTASFALKTNFGDASITL